MQNRLIYNLWYVATPSCRIRRGSTMAKTMLGHSLLLGRDASGTAFALRDFCPHRGIPLRFGNFDGTTIECCYHGWCFDTGGTCTKIPSLTDDDITDISRIKAFKYPCVEKNGLIWVFIPPLKGRIPETLPEVPDAPQPADYLHVETVLLPCNIDHAVIGLMDPAHGPFVHRSWWWRSRKSIHAKEKRFAPVGLGFRMVSHKPSSNSRAYKVLGGERTTEITFQLPALRSEHIQIGNKYILLLTALTPKDEAHTELQQYIATNITLVKWLLPLLKPFGKAFIRQDVRVVKMQQEGLQPDHPPLMLLGDADQQALWYFKLKKDFLAAQDSGTPFENHVPEKVLRWKS